LPGGIVIGAGERGHPAEMPTLRWLEATFCGQGRPRSPFASRDDRRKKRCDSACAMRVRLTKDFSFEAAQTLPNAPEGHKCRRMHGHSFKVEISVEGDVDPATGWFYDHAEIGAAMKPLVQQVDHAYLNEIAGLDNPTIENMAAWFWQKLQPLCPGLCEIVVHETPTARCVYRGE
jgi:6-pyruvoyltetrahydropterin/6-carboxytetrahydropterin synthase